MLDLHTCVTAGDLLFQPGLAHRRRCPQEEVALATQKRTVAQTFLQCIYCHLTGEQVALSFRLEGAFYDDF